MAGLGSSQGNKFKFLSMRYIQEDDSSYFCEMEKVGGSWVPTEKHTYIEGKLVDINLKTQKTSKGEEYEKIVLAFDLGQNLPIHKVDMGFGMLSRSLINTLCSCASQIQNGEELNISLYTNNNGYGAVCVREPGSSGKDGMYGWKYKLTDLPQPVPHMISGKKVYDYANLDLMIKKMITDKIKPYCPGIPERDAPQASGNSGGLPDDSPEPRQHSSTPAKTIKQETGLDLPDPDDMGPDDLPF